MNGKLSSNFCFGFFLFATIFSTYDRFITFTSADGPVVNLTSQTFDNTLNENEFVLVKFFAPWCGHCKTMAPEYIKAAEELAARGSSAVLAEVDATKEESIAEVQQIRGYPTLKFFRNRVAEEYTGGRSSTEIVDWITLMTGPALVECTDFDEKIKEDDPSVAIAGAFKSKTGAYEVYDKAANNMRSMGKFYVKVSDSVEKDTIYVKHRNEEKIYYEGEITYEKLTAWLKKESLPLFGPISGENFKNYSDKELDFVWVCSPTEEYGIVREKVRDAAKNFRETLAFVHLDTKQFEAHAKGALGVKDYPAMVIQTKTGRYVHPSFNTSISTDDVVSFIQDVQGGKIEKNLRSEEEPETNDKPVKIVVGKSFEKLVMDDSKDVLLEVYAPWCGHCKKLEPTYQELAEKYADTPNLVIAKMDGSENESPVETFTWTGFPTIFFKPAGAKEPIKHKGDRTLASLEAFVKENAKAAKFTISGKSEEL